MISPTGFPEELGEPLEQDGIGFPDQSLPPIDHEIQPAGHGLALEPDLAFPPVGSDAPQVMVSGPVASLTPDLIDEIGSERIKDTEAEGGDDKGSLLRVGQDKADPDTLPKHRQMPFEDKGWKLDYGDVVPPAPLPYPEMEQIKHLKPYNPFKTASSLRVSTARINSFKSRRYPTGHCVSCGVKHGEEHKRGCQERSDTRKCPHCSRTAPEGEIINHESWCPDSCCKFCGSTEFEPESLGSSCKCCGHYFSGNELI